MANISSLAEYVEWVTILFTPVPDAHCEVKFFAEDEARNSVAAFAVFRGTQTGPGGPVSPMGNTISAEYVYHMEFEGDRIRHMTKVWNDDFTSQSLYPMPTPTS